MIELVVTDIMSKASDHRAHLLMLRERDGLRRVMVALGMLEAQAVILAMRNLHMSRPTTHDLFSSLSSTFGLELLHTLIYRINDGTFCSRLFYKQGEAVRSIEARTSDAVALALRSNAPIYITDELLEKMCIRDEQNGAISVPITVVDESTLRSALDKAVKEENYELAMKLKEEIDARHKNADNDKNTINTI